jgi:hypothetical protein
MHDLITKDNLIPPDEKALLILEKIQAKLENIEKIPEKDAGNVFTFAGGDAVIIKRTLKEVINIIKKVINEN